MAVHNINISSFFMRRMHGWGPNGKFCADCISMQKDDIDIGDGYCRHPKASKKFVVYGEFKACGLFKSQWQYERELLEAQGQRRIPFRIREKIKNAYDLPPGAEMADQDWTTPGFWLRTVH
jgi:hypothetical protein